MQFQIGCAMAQLGFGLRVGQCKSQRPAGHGQQEQALMRIGIVDRAAAASVAVTVGGCRVPVQAADGLESEHGFFELPR